MPSKRLLDGLPYTPSALTDLRRLFDRIAPGWNVRPAHLEPRAEVRDRINGWTTREAGK